MMSSHFRYHTAASILSHTVQQCPLDAIGQWPPSYQTRVWLQSSALTYSRLSFLASFPIPIETSLRGMAREMA